MSIKLKDTILGYATKSDLATKQDSITKYSNQSASTWIKSNEYEGFPYRCDISCSGVTSAMYAEVIFSLEQSISEKYAPICETKPDVVSIWSAENTTIIVPTILITK